MFSNSHTPLIAHTADDSLTIYTGLYGDRHGQPVTNSYNTYNPDGIDRPGDLVRLLDEPGRRHREAADGRPRRDSDDGLLADRAGDTARPDAATPAPWVPFTRAGCSVGDFSTANMVLENTKLDLTTVFGPSSPEVAQLAADPRPFKDPEVADYIGVAVHCAKGDTICANAQAVKFGQTTPSPSAVTDLLPTEPGGYTGYPGAVRRTGTSRRSSARARRT